MKPKVRSLSSRRRGTNGGRPPLHPGEAMKTANIYARITLVDYLISVGLAAGAKKHGALARGFEIVVNCALQNFEGIGETK